MSAALMDGYDVVVIGGGPAGLNGALMLVPYHSDRPRHPNS